jgi:tetratricopeptide (TPR) repeat protein
MFSNLKTMMFTMIIAIAIFIWIYTFAGSIAVRTISLPWEPRWPLTEPIPICGAPGIGYWIIIYTLLSIPISQLILRSLKYISFSKEVKLEEALEHTRVAEALTALENAIADADKLGVRVPKARELLQRAKRAAEGRSYEEATMHTKDAENLIEEAMRTHKKTIDLLDTAKSMLASAEQRGIGVRASLEAYKKAEKAMRNMEYSTAIYYAKQTQRLIKEARKQHKTSEEAIADMKSVMYDIKDIKAPEAERLLREAERAMASKEYDKVLGLAKEGKRVAEKIRKSYQELLEKLARAQELLRECKAAGIEVDGAEELLRNADTAMRQQEYEKALGLAVECIEYAEKEKGRYQEATEAVSFAKLVIANAEGFGVDVAEPRSLLQMAEDLLAQGDYENTIKYATQAKDLAEGAKRRMQRELKRMR